MKRKDWLPPEKRERLEQFVKEAKNELFEYMLSEPKEGQVTIDPLHIMKIKYLLNIGEEASSDGIDVMILYMVQLEHSVKNASLIAYCVYGNYIDEVRVVESETKYTNGYLF